MDVFVNDGLLIDIKKNQMMQETMQIHTDYIDEGAEDEDFFHTTAPSDPEDWRSSSRNFKDKNETQRPDFSRFFVNEWRGARMAAKHLKYCPGELCKQWFPLHHFATNYNMSDKLDVYCLSCNQNKRHQRTNTKFSTPRERNPLQPDKYELFNKAFNRNSVPVDAVTMKSNAIAREMEKRITEAAKLASTRYNKNFNFDPVEIERKLFQGGKNICNITGQILTRECFLDHHALTFEYKRKSKKIDIICSQCRKGSPPVWFKK